MKENDTSKRDDRDEAEAGWTFIETIIVMFIILILSSSVGFMGIRYLDNAKVTTAKSQIESFSLALDAYYLDSGVYPSESQGLGALWASPGEELAPEHWRGPYLSKPLPKDPWGNEYEYLVPGQGGLPFGIRSFGKDGSEGGEGNDADIVSWE